MNKKFYPFLFLSGIFIFLAGMYLLDQPSEVNQQELSKGERIELALQDNFERTKDLELGYPPQERLITALKQTRRKQLEMANLRGTIANPRFRERGPNNIGGRTRTILIDLNDPERKTLWAGGVSGGLWKTTNIDAEDPQWTAVNDYFAPLPIGAIVQDPSNPQIMFVGTGEGHTGIRGNGIFKSSDGGETWELLPSTLTGNFLYTQALLVHPETGDVYAGTTFGLFKSTNGGLTWTKVHGSGFGANNFFYDLKYASNGFMIASNASAVFRSLSGDPNSWEKISKGPVPEGLSRVEVTVCESDPDVMYLIGSQDGGATKVYSTTNGGDTWQPRAQPIFPNSEIEFTRGQAGYDLDISVNPDNCQEFIVGGVPIRRSLDAGFSLVPYGGAIHVDQHLILYDEATEGKIYHTSDGGIYRVFNPDLNPIIENKNQGYNVTQFYTCALHPEMFSDYILGGTQDNYSLQMNSVGIGPAIPVRDGDGAFCHIDQIDPQYQMVSSQGGNYSLSIDGGNNWAGGYGFNGSFISPSDYDSEAKIMYSQTNDGDFYRWNILTGQIDLVDITGIPNNFFVSRVHVDPNVSNRVYFGGFGIGQIVRVDNAHSGSSVEGTLIGTLSGTVSSIDVELGDPDHLMVTLSNYGLTNNIWESKDGGATWQGVEGSAVPDNLPDMPVRWGIFSPNDGSQAMIATEVGVWTTELLDGNNTVWIPPIPDRGIPLVRTTMLQWRTSDRVVLAATYGRGMFTTDVFADPLPRLLYPQVHYINSPLYFQGELSLNADEYFWDFGDGGTSTTENLFHTYSEIGEYEVSLKINDDDGLVATSPLKILPERPIPYQPGGDQYSGDFEGFPEQYGVHTLRGSAFERGNSNVSGKDGTHGGQNAFVVGLNEVMQPNTNTVLYLPNFDLAEAGIYEFSFWAKFQLENGLDGFRVEYSEDGGQTWKVLGADVSENWYNTSNPSLLNGAFPPGNKYFSKTVSQFTEFKLNISELSGRGNVAFRFVAKSDDGGAAAGLAIDDVKITRFEGALETALTNFDGEFSGSTEITLNWSTQPEFNCVLFELEESENGKDFEKVETEQATGGTTDQPQTYSAGRLAQRDIYFYRLKVINENTEQDYAYEFYSPEVVIRRSFIEGTEIFRVFPNPFSDYIDITFNNQINATVQYDLFDVAGRQIVTGKQQLAGSSYLQITVNPIPAGIYFLRVQIGDNDAQTVKLLGGVGQ